MPEGSYKHLTDKDYIEINNNLAGSEPLEIIKWTYKTFKDELVYACSFGAEGIVLLDLISKIRPDAHVIFNSLHKRGYPSIGCMHCTFPVKDGSDLRSGRWTGLTKTECGLHLNSSNNEGVL